MSGKVRIKYGVAMSSIHNSTQEDVYEMERSEWEAMTKEERDDFLDSLADTALANNVDAWAYVVEDES